MIIKKLLIENNHLTMQANEFIKFLGKSFLSSGQRKG
jgi:hypothetical protein